MNMLISNLLLLSNLTFFSNSLLEERLKNKYIFSLFFTIGVMLLTNMNYTNFGLMGTIIMSLFYTLYVFVLFKGNLYKKILIILLFILTISLSEILIANIMNSIFKLRPEHINSGIYFIALISSNLLSFIVLLSVSKVMKKEIINKYPKFMWLCLILPMTTLFFLFNFTNYFSTFRDNAFTLIVIIGLVISNVISLMTMIREFRRIELDNEVKQMRLKYDVLNTQYNTNFYFLHDTIRKLTRLTVQIDENNFTEFKKEIMDLNSNLTNSFNTINSNSEILNFLLNYRITDINEFNIVIKTVIEYNGFNFISLEDQQFIFSELLSIAINSCKKCNLEKPRIMIKTKKVDHQITILCSFSHKKMTTINSLELQRVIEKNNGKILEDVKTNNELEYYDLLIVFFDC